MEVNFSNPIYDIGPSLPQECQEPWAALMDTAAVGSIVPQSFVPHIPVKEKPETLTNVNGGNTKVLGVKHVTFFITGRSSFMLRFLIVEDFKNPIIDPNAIHHHHLQLHLQGKGKCILQLIKVITMRQVWPFQIMEFTTLDNQSTSNVSAEIDDKIISDSRKIVLEEEESERCLSASSGTSMCQGSFNTQLSRKRTS